MKTRSVSILTLLPLMLSAQSPRDVAPLKYWPAPLYWQPTQAESRVAAKSERFSAASPQVAPPGQVATSLAFVAMTPCRLVDTRVGFGFSGAFGPPALVGGATRAFPLQTSTTCSIPTTVQAYSLNITIVPPGQMFYLTIWPLGVAQPNVSTQNDLLGTVIANAAIVPAGNDAGSGSVNVFVSNNTDLIIDINGYYAPQSGITLSQGSVAAPSLSFAGDAGTGIYSSGAGLLNASVGGTQALSIGNVNGDTAVGAGALAADTTGSFDTAVGLGALQANTTGNSNTAVGDGALNSNTTGSHNTSVGTGSMQTNTTGATNAALGQGALHLNTTGNDNTALGYTAVYNNTTGNGNTAIGSSALYSNTTGNGNTATGEGVLEANTTGSNNTVSGQAAMYNNTTGFNNTVSGQNAMNSNTTGCCNTASGQAALNANTTGGDNSAFGGSALQNNTTGNNNSAVGQYALLNNTTGSDNAALGQGALIAATTATNNTAVGQNALSSVTIGGFNVAIGQGAGSGLGAGSSGNIIIGNPGTAGDIQTTRIGLNQTSFYAAGIYNVTVSGGIPVYILSNGQLGTVSSSIRFKEDVHDMADASSGLLQLRPVTYRYKQPLADGSKPIDYGLIAEEVAEIYPDLVARDSDGAVQTVQYQKLTPMLLNELQKQAEAIRQLQAQLAAIQSQKPVPAEK